MRLVRVVSIWNGIGCAESAEEHAIYLVYKLRLSCKSSNCKVLLM
jgi:hypothetical protein